MIKYTSLTIFVWILALLNSFMDKRKSAFNYPEWHKEFKHWNYYHVFKVPFMNKLIVLDIVMPFWIWSKFRNKWHIVKQSYFYSSSGYIANIAVSDLSPIFAILGFVFIIIVGQFIWSKAITDPAWWNKEIEDED